MIFLAQTLAPPSYVVPRDGAWLRSEMEFLWSRFFDDVSPKNVVQVEYSGAWKSRLGVISMSSDAKVSYIGINSLLRFPEVPAYVTTITVAHELVHYAHGFGSPLPQKYKHPHRGGIVQKELIRRGLKADFDLYNEWIHTHWYSFYGRRKNHEPVVLTTSPSVMPSVNSRVMHSTLTEA
jgi:hypothetical protein